MTTFNTGNYVRITGRQSGGIKSHRLSLLSPSPSFPPSNFFSLSSFRATLHYPNACNRLFPRRKANDHVSVTFLSSHFRSSLFPFFSSFLTHVQDRMINVSEILPLRPIKVNNGKFYLLLRSGHFVNACIFTRVYVICKICEKLRRIRSCRYLLDLSQSVLQ